MHIKLRKKLTVMDFFNNAKLDNSCYKIYKKDSRLTNREDKGFAYLCICSFKYSYKLLNCYHYGIYLSLLFIILNFLYEHFSFYKIFNLSFVYNI